MFPFEAFSQIGSSIKIPAQLCRAFRFRAQSENKIRLHHLKKIRIHHQGSTGKRWC